MSGKRFMSMPSPEENEALLPEEMPVTLPDLPPTLRVHTAQQFKALGDVTRERILSLIKHEPLTGKQISERLNVPPGTVGHHLQVLEAAGLAQIVARRLIHGIVAKYYTRTARLFQFDFPPEVTPPIEGKLKFLLDARDELADTLLTEEEEGCGFGFPHARLSRERAAAFRKRLNELLYEFATAEPDPDGQVYALCTAFFLAPPYLQSPRSAATSGTEEK